MKIEKNIVNKNKLWLLKHWKLILSISLPLLLVAMYFIYILFIKNIDDTEKSDLKTTTVVRGDLESYVKVLGKVQLADEQRIRFNQTGKIINVNYRAGDKVKKGDVIAELSSKDLNNEVAQGRINIKNEEIDLDTAENSKDYEIFKTKKDLDEAKRTKESAEEEVKSAKEDQDINSRERAVEIQNKKDEKKDLQDALKEYQEELKTYTVGSSNYTVTQSKIETTQQKITTKDTDIEEAEKNDQDKNKQEERTVKQKERAVKNADNLIEETEKYYSQLRDEADRISEQAKNNVDIQNLVLKKIEDGKEKYQLIAPLDATIRKIDFKEGDNIVFDDEKYVYLDNPEFLSVVINLNQMEAVKANVGQEAKIVLDSLPTITFKGEIESIDQTPKEKEGDVFYEAHLVLNKEGAKIFSGMTGIVTIATETKQNVLIVPSLSVSDIGNGINIGKVKKIVDGELVENEVEIGLNDGKNCEIINGLSEGDEIVEIDFNLIDETLESNYGYEDSSSDDEDDDYEEIDEDVEAPENTDLET